LIGLVLEDCVVSWRVVNVFSNFRNICEFTILRRWTTRYRSYLVFIFLNRLHLTKSFRSNRFEDIKVLQW